MNADQYKLPLFGYFLAGNISGILTRALCQPLDVLKIRFQLQVEDSKNAKYSGLSNMIVKIYKEEGLKAFWKGHIPAQFLSLIFGGFQFGTYEYLQMSVPTILEDLICLYDKNRSNGSHKKHSSYTTNNVASSQVKKKKHFLVSPLSNFISGGISGILATVITLPLDVIRTRLIAQGESLKLYTGFIQGTKLLLKNEGYHALFKGFTPAVIQIAPYSGLYFMFYNSMKDFYKKSFPHPKSKAHSQLPHFIFGATSGMCAKVLVYPFDTMKKRFQVQGFEEARAPFGKTVTYRGTLDCIFSMYKHEGFLSFYKGMTPTLLKAAMTTGFMFYFYDYACIILKDLPKTKKNI